MFSRKKLKVEITIFATDRTAQETQYADVFASVGLSENMVNGFDWFKEGNVLTFDDFKIDADIRKVYSEIGPTATVRIYGVSKQHMDMITHLILKETSITPKRIRIYADNGNGYSLIFEGCITEAVPIYKSAPNYYIQIESSMAAFDNAMTPPPESIAPNTAISDACKQTCLSYGVSCYVDDNVKGTVGEHPPRLDMKGLGKRLGVLSRLYDITPIYYPSGYRIFAKGVGSRRVWKFTPKDYFGYPSFTQQNMCIDTDKIEGIEIADLFKISDSEVGYANGYWYINKIHYRLQTRIDNGKWYATLYGTPINEEAFGYLA